MKENLALLLQRVEDSKTNVRKSALQVLKKVISQIPAVLLLYVPCGSLWAHTSCAVSLQTLVALLKHDVIPMKWETLATVSDRCRDPAVSVKKKALQCVDDLLSVSLQKKRERVLKNKFSMRRFFV